MKSGFVKEHKKEADYNPNIVPLNPVQKKELMELYKEAALKAYPGNDHFK